MAIFLWPRSTIVLSEPTDSVSNDEPIGKNMGLLNHTALATVMVDFVGAVAAPGVARGAGLDVPGVAAPGVGLAAAPPDDAPAATEAVAPPATGVWVRAAVPPAAAGEVPPAAGVAAPVE